MGELAAALVNVEDEVEAAAEVAAAAAAASYADTTSS